MKPEKRSITIAGHATSVSLEPLFWDALKEMAAQNKQSVPDLIRQLDAETQKPACHLLCGWRCCVGRGSSRVKG